MRPVIAITTSFSDGTQQLEPAYAHCVERAGGMPVIVPFFVDRTVCIDFFGRVHGLIIPGGPAVTEGLVGSLPEDIATPAPKRMLNDHWALAAAFERSIPVLGICYGMQLVNGFFGGTIYADVDSALNLDRSHSEKRGGLNHPLLIEAGSHLEDLLGRQALNVNSRHIQAIASLANSLNVCGRADDGVIEAIESNDAQFLGVQFHPEQMDPPIHALFHDLVVKATRHAQT